MATLVTGGAGYIGSVTVEHLRAAGDEPVILDALDRGHAAAVPDGVRFFHGRVGDAGLVRRICESHAIDACIHFAALAYVGESVTDPRRYFDNNVVEGLTLLGALLDAGVRKIVFSSTCATYGEPEKIPIDERAVQSPTNPYGWTKLVLERALASYDRAYALKHVALRYFNAAGATEACGEDHRPETHLIPIVLEAAAGKRPFVPVLGDDYPTPDGTAIRDYIHVGDLAAAHLLALSHLRRGGGSLAVNLGTGRGHSVAEVVALAREVTGRPIEMRVVPRRPGDPARLVADPTNAALHLGWKPARADLRDAIRDAWSWMCRHPEGYPR